MSELDDIGPSNFGLWWLFHTLFPGGPDEDRFDVLAGDYVRMLFEMPEVNEQETILAIAERMADEYTIDGLRDLAWLHLSNTIRMLFQAAEDSQEAVLYDVLASAIAKKESEAA